MKYNYEIYTCNDGNPTALIVNCNDEKMYIDIAEQLYKTKKVDQVAVILDVNDKRCTFQLVNGEFCGNACLSICSYMYENYKVKVASIINKIFDKKGNVEYIKIDSKFDGKIGNLLIPKELFLNDNNSVDNFVKMSGITHLIIPESFGNNNEEYARKKIKKLEEKNIDLDILGIVFLEDNKIDPFIWIKRIKLLQHQSSCLSASIAALEYLQKNNRINEDRIIQPSGEAYIIKFKDNNIDITGIVRKIETGIVEVQLNVS